MTIDLGKRSGSISLAKGQKVTIEKTPKISATCTFSSKTDYDVYAVIRMVDGTEKVCSTFGSESQRQPTPQVAGVEHLGDVVRGGNSDLNVETLQINNLGQDIDQIAITVYSAQSNGTGSFYRYKVSMTVDNGAGTNVTINAADANDNDNIYTCVPAIIKNTPDGVVIEQVEQYSRPGSELRPSFSAGKKGGLFSKGSASGELAMDTGSKNLYK